jgi:hypothetical protein
MIYANYRPRPDITTYELAVLLPALVRSPTVFSTGFLTFTSGEWEAMGEHVQRHFERYEGDVEAEEGSGLLRHLLGRGQQ